MRHQSAVLQDSKLSGEAFWAVLLAVTFSISGFGQPAQEHYNRILIGAGRPATKTANLLSMQHQIRTPLVFEVNRGQADPQVRFIAHGTGYSLFLTSRDAIFAFRNSPPVRMRLVNAKPAETIEAVEPTGGVSNYYYGNDPLNWRKGVPHYRKVYYREVYPGVDERFYEDNGKIEFDLIAAPGADVAQIQIEYDGVNAARINAGGDLLLATAAGDLRMRRPNVYQINADGRELPVAAAFRITGPRRATFLLAHYDSRRQIVIDPTVEYSTYLGGSFSDQAAGVALDTSGNAYVTGHSQSRDFPTLNASSTGSHFAGGQGDAFVTKINPSGTAVIYSTYLGGADDDFGNGIAVDGAGNAYVAGTTYSKDFPIQNPLQISLKASGKGSGNAFVTKFDPVGRLIYSTFLGGSVGDAASSIAVDASGNAYITGITESPDFPTKNSLQPFNGGIAAGIGVPVVADAFISKISPDGSTLVYSTFLGGSSIDQGNSIALDASGNSYVIGFTASADFPLKMPLQSARGGYFITKLNAQGSSIVYSTYLTGGPNLSNAISVDSNGNAYVVGSTQAANFPTVKALFPTLPLAQTAGFVAKLNVAGSAFIFSTFLPGCMPNGVATDAAGNVYVVGRSGTTRNFPLMNALQTAGGAVLTAFTADGSALLYSTYLGGVNTSAQAIASDNAGDVFVTGYGSQLPAGPAFQPRPAGQNNAFVFAYFANAAPSVMTVSAASSGTAIAPNSIASIFGGDLATQTTTADSSSPLATTLGGTTVNLTDAAGNTTPVNLLYVSPGEVRFLVPPGIPIGAGQILVTSGDGVRSVGPVQIASVAPGIFTADGSLAVGTAVQMDADGNQTSQPLVQRDIISGNFIPIPIDLGASTGPTTLILYGTGIRNATFAEITVNIDGQTIAPTFAGIQNPPPGEDQVAGKDEVDLQIPSSLAGAGDVTITLTAAGIDSNTVHITIQ